MGVTNNYVKRAIATLFQHTLKQEGKLTGTIKLQDFLVNFLYHLGSLAGRQPTDKCIWVKHNTQLSNLYNTPGGRFYNLAFKGAFIGKWRPKGKGENAGTKPEQKEQKLFWRKQKI